MTKVLIQPGAKFLGPYRTSFADRLFGALVFAHFVLIETCAQQRESRVLCIAGATAARIRAAAAAAVRIDPFRL